MVHGLSCSVACGIFPDQGSNPCPLHRQADSSPLHHQGSSPLIFCVFFAFKSIGFLQMLKGSIDQRKRLRILNLEAPCAPFPCSFLFFFSLLPEDNTSTCPFAFVVPFRTPWALTVFIIPILFVYPIL